MNKVINSINNAFRYKKNCFKVIKSNKTTLFLKCLVKSNILRYFKTYKCNYTNKIMLQGYINVSNYFQIKQLSKNGRKVYSKKNKIKFDINSFFILTNNVKKGYHNNFETNPQGSGEFIAKIFI